MRITFLVPGRGLVGNIKVMGEYAGRLRARGHEVRVLYRRSPRNLKGLLRQWLSRRPTDALDDSGCPLAPVRAFGPEVVPDGDVVIATGLPTVRAAAALPPQKGRLFSRYGYDPDAFIYQSRLTPTIPTAVVAPPIPHARIGCAHPSR